MSQADRPRTVAVVLWGTWLLALYNGVRVFVLTRQMRLLLALAIQPDPRFRLVGAFVWMILFVGAALLLWRQRRIIRRLLPILLASYALYELLLLALFAQVALSAFGWLGCILLAALAVGFAQWALNTPAATSYLRQEGSAADTSS